MKGWIVVLSLACAGADDCNGGILSADEVQTSKQQADMQARALGYTPLGIACVNRDSDVDGYVSCMVRIEGQSQPLTWECSYGRFGASGCRTPKPKAGGGS